MANESTYFPKWLWLPLWFAVGFAVSRSYMLSPLHEIWHVRASERQGIPARVTSSTTAELDDFSSEAMWAGYGMELVFSTVFSIAGALIGRAVKGGWMIGGAGLGYGIDTYIRAFSSWDLNGLPREWVMNQFPAGKAEAIWQGIHVDILQAWAIRGGMLILLMLAAIGLCYWTRKKPQKAGALS